MLSKRYRQSSPWNSVWSPVSLKQMSYLAVLGDGFFHPFDYWIDCVIFCLDFLSDLNLSNNQINKLPDELADLTQLLRLDISHNLFLSLPKVVFKMPKLRQLKASNNAIIGKRTSHFCCASYDTILPAENRFWVSVPSISHPFVSILFCCRCRNRRNHHNRFTWIGRPAKESADTAVLGSLAQCTCFVPHSTTRTYQRGLGGFKHLKVFQTWRTFHIHLSHKKDSLYLVCWQWFVESHWIL